MAVKAFSGFSHCPTLLTNNPALKRLPCWSALSGPRPLSALSSSTGHAWLPCPRSFGAIVEFEKLKSAVCVVSGRLASGYAQNM